MAEVGIAGVIGVMMGAWRMQQLRGEARRLVERRGSFVWLILAGSAMRLLPLLGLTGLVLTRSPAAAGAALGGYWLGRTTTLLRDIMHPRVKGG